MRFLTFHSSWGYGSSVAEGFSSRGYQAHHELITHVLLHYATTETQANGSRTPNIELTLYYFAKAADYALCARPKEKL